MITITIILVVSVVVVVAVACWVFSFIAWATVVCCFGRKVPTLSVVSGCLLGLFFPCLK